MGEVYRARDAALGRDLAIKILPPELTRDPSRVERFTQEARAASALNHPHLVAIYEIGSEPVHYIAMELVHGKNLREVLNAGRLDLKRALDYLLQVADALGAAHQNGVVHRDIKPENVMIADTGYAKVLDFGVAKLRSDASTGADDATRAALTSEGMAVGTSGYMSPEQVRGQTADHRTDIFSFGCVLYECLTGTRAFDAPSQIERLNRVIKDEPAPIAERAPGVPADLSRIVRKCLAKDPDERYQSMKDLAIDLRDVRRQLDTGVSTSSQTSPAARRAPRTMVWALAALVVIAGLALIYFSQRGSTSSHEAAGRLTVERITTTSNTIDAAISPDGTYLAHVEAIGNRQTLWIRDVKTGQDRQLVPEGPYAFYGVRFSPDNREIFYTVRGQGYGSGRLYAMSRDGGEPRVLLSGIVTPVTFSPGGRQFAFYREQFPDQDSSSLMVADGDGKNERILQSRRAPEGFLPGFFAAPSWSPDGRTIAASVRHRANATATLLVIDATSSQTRELVSVSDDITHTLWLPDGSGIVYVRRGAVGLGGNRGQLWLKPFPDGAPRQITNDLLDYRQSSITSDGTMLTAIGQELQSQIYVVPLDGSPPQRVRSERFDGAFGLVQLRDGSFIAGTMVNGNAQIVRLSPDGSRRTALTNTRVNTLPALSPDESTIAMVSIENGKFGVWTMNVDGGNQQRLADVAAPGWLSFTHDGRFVICTSYPTSTASTWRIPVTGGQPIEIARQFERAAISPDGKWLGGVYNASVNAETMAPMIAVVPLDGSAPVRALQPMALATGTGLLTWTQDSAGIIASSNERFNLFFFPITGEAPKRLTNLSDEMFLFGALSADGKSMAASRGRLLRDTFLMRGFR